MNFLRNIKTSLGLDYRSLALYRFLMGIIVMADVVYRWGDLANFYTDVGLVPRNIFISEMTMPWSLSLHLANGSLEFAKLMFGINFIFGLMLMLGYKTRCAIIGAFVMCVSVHNRNWLVNNGGDDIMRSILFISIFLPMNRVFSLDSALTKGKHALKEVHFSTWGWMFFFQVFAIYFVSYILKDHAIWRTEYKAVFYAGRLDIFSNPIGVWMRNFPTFETLTTIFTIYLEWLGPLVLIFSFLAGRFWWIPRMLVVALFWFLHAGIIATMWIGVFPYTCLAMWSIFIPGPVWDKLTDYFRRKNFGKLSIFYDGDCRFCQKAVLTLKEFFLLKEVALEKVQGTSYEQDFVRENSWVLVNERGEKFFHFSAMQELMRHSPVLKWFAPITSLKVGNAIYKWVANNRQLMSKYTQFFEFKEEKKPIAWLNWVYQLAGAFMLTTLIMWNVTTIKKWNVSAPFWQNITRWVHLYQEWNMFAPFPKMDNIWIEIPAVLGNGGEIELITGDQDIYSVKDQAFYKAIPNEHWRKFFLNVSERADYARYYGGFLCRKWNDRNIRWVPDTTLRKFEIIVYSQMNLPDGQKGPITKKLSWKHWCFDEDYKREAAQPKAN